MARSDQVEPLKLTAMDAAELRLVAACLQDGLTRLAEMTYLPSKHRFVAVFNRFMWERLDDGKSQPLDGRLYHRVSSGVHFNGVLAARLQGIQQDAKDPFLELLTITCDGADDAEDGARDQTITLVFAGGAAGKFVCGYLAQSLGVIRSVVLTEIITGGGILLLLALPLDGVLVLLPLIGMGLNGTSSVLYGTVTDFVAEERRARGFGLFYTLAIGGGAVAPTLFGLLSDFSGVTMALSAVAIMTLAVIPLCGLLVRPLARIARNRAADR